MNLETLTKNEIRLLKAISENPSATVTELANTLYVKEDALMQYAYGLQERGILKIERKVTHNYYLTPEGEIYKRDGLPERQLIKAITGRVHISELQDHPLAKIAIGQMKKKEWITITDGWIEPTGSAQIGDDEILLQKLALQPERLK